MMSNLLPCMCVLIITVVALVGQSVVAAEKLIAVTDSIVKKAIRERLEKPEGKLTKADLEKVTRLDLSGTQITDAGLKEVAKLQKLEWLYLGGPQINDQSLKEVAKLHNLEQLSLHGTNVTEAGVAELKKALPNCEILGLKSSP